jgi:hypothetical protein
VQDTGGVSDFEALQAALRSQPTRLIFYVKLIDGHYLKEQKLG